MSILCPTPRITLLEKRGEQHVFGLELIQIGILSLYKLWGLTVLCRHLIRYLILILPYKILLYGLEYYQILTDRYYPVCKEVTCTYSFNKQLDHDSAINANAKTPLHDIRYTPLLGLSLVYSAPNVKFTCKNIRSTNNQIEMQCARGILLACASGCSSRAVYVFIFFNIGNLAGIDYFVIC